MSCCIYWYIASMRGEFYCGWYVAPSGHLCRESKSHWHITQVTDMNLPMRGVGRCYWIFYLIDNVNYCYWCLWNNAHLQLLLNPLVLPTTWWEGVDGVIYILFSAKAHKISNNISLRWVCATEEMVVLVYAMLYVLKPEYREMLFRVETEHSDKELYRIIAQSRPVQMISY